MNNNAQCSYKKGQDGTSWVVCRIRTRVYILNLLNPAGPLGFTGGTPADIQFGRRCSVKGASGAYYKSTAGAKRIKKVANPFISFPFSGYKVSGLCLDVSRLHYLCLVRTPVAKNPRWLLTMFILFLIVDCTSSAMANRCLKFIAMVCMAFANLGHVTMHVTAVNWDAMRF